MNAKNRTRTVFKGFLSVTRVLVWIGYVALASIILMTFADGSGRYLLNSPLLGAIEVVEASMIILAGFAIMYATIKQEHVVIDFVLGRLPKLVQTKIQRLASFLGFISWAVIAYWLFYTMPEPSEVSSGVVQYPLLPFRLILTIAIILSLLTLLMQALHPGLWEEAVGKKEGGTIKE